MRRLPLPLPLKPGDRVAVVSPASPFAAGELEAGLFWLRARYRVEVGPHTYARHGFLAGTDEQRARDLTAALLDPGVRAIFCARGGHGVLRLLDALPFAALVGDPKWICGFSDITALHATANGLGVASLHGPNLTGLGRASAAERDELLALLESPAISLVWSGLSLLHGADGVTADGPLFGGNLAILHALAAAGRLRVPEGAIVLLEDIGERPYRLDRMLVALRLAGHLARASAIVLGDFHECGPSADGITARQVLADDLSRLSIPVWESAPFGHTPVNRPIPLGVVAHIQGTTLRIASC